MALSKALTDLLIPLWEAYRNARLSGGMMTNTVADFNYNFKTILQARIDALVSQEKEQDQEMRECRFMLRLNENGWTVGDMEFFAKLYETIDNLEPKDEKGLALLEELSQKKITTRDERADCMSMVGNYVSTLQSRLKDPAPLVTSMNEVLSADLTYGEYPEDKDFEKILRKEGTFSSRVVVEKGKRLDARKGLFLEAGYRQKRSEDNKQKSRDLDTYVMEELSDTEIESVPLNYAQKVLNLKTTNRQAIKEVFGEEIFDEIDEKHIGTEEERTIRIHHALGNQLIKDGHSVLEFDLAGTGYMMPRREHQGQHGKESAKELTAEEIQGSLKDTYGEVVEDKNGKIYPGIRCKAQDYKLKDGAIVNKTRFSIQGPNLVNIGDYSIENTRVYVKNLTKEYLVDLFDKWSRKEEEPRDIYVLISGHSRGAVSAGESVHYIQKWLDEYVSKHEKKNPECRDYANRIKKVLLQRDAVPGAGTNIRLGKNDLRKIPNLNATVFCSMAQEHTDMAFPLQQVRGAQRIIISTTSHSMDLAEIDLSQRTRAEDGSAHQVGLYDAETGEFYRKSGISQMPEGVYITDERYNVIRLTSYSQLGKLVDSVYAGKPKQEGRVSALHKMVRNWFYDNNLTMSFKTEGEYEKAKDKALMQMEKLMGTSSKRLRQIQGEIRKLDELLISDASREQVAAQNKKLIEACRAYMKKTDIPAVGARAEKMDMVCDLLTFAQRENNYFEKGLDRSPVKPKEGRNERQLEKEKERLEQEKQLRTYIERLGKGFQSQLEKCSNMIGDKRTGAENAVLAQLKKAAQIQPDQPLSQIRQTLLELGGCADTTIRANESSNARRTIRLVSIAKHLRGDVESVGTEFDKRTRYYGDMDGTINERISEREAKIAHLESVIENGGKEPEKLQARQRVEEAIRNEKRRFDALKRQAAAGQKPALGRNNLAMSAAKLVFLETIRDAEAQNGYANAKGVMAKLADHRLLEIAALPIAERPGFAKLAGTCQASQLKEKYDALIQKPAKQRVM
ncbi:MAG: hypothetical protein K6E18_01990 [Lachnospiraceae bacterium]|nr:hypothetical protein [Lachnospiraceae bacterium]